MSEAAVNLYHARFRKVLVHIDSNLADELDVESLSQVAAFSKYHFHRQFAALFGLGVYRYVQLSRLKRASYQLAFRQQMSVMEVALENGYEGPEAFARAFKKCAGQSPLAFRKQPNWLPWLSVQSVLSDSRNQVMHSTHTLNDVRIVDFKATDIALLEHRGDPRLIGETNRAFIEWRKQNRLPPKISATFNIAHTPLDCPPKEFRFGIAAAITASVTANTFGVTQSLIPAGRCAVLRHTGPDDSLPATCEFLYSQWLSQSTEELRDFPLFFQRVSFYPDVPESEAITDVFLPLS